MAKYLIKFNRHINASGSDPFIITYETWEDALIDIKNELNNDDYFQVDCFNGTLEAPEPLTVKEYKQFLINMINAGIGNDYHYFA